MLYHSKSFNLKSLLDKKEKLKILKFEPNHKSRRRRQGNKTTKREYMSGRMKWNSTISRRPKRHHNIWVQDVNDDERRDDMGFSLYPILFLTCTNYFSPSYLLIESHWSTKVIKLRVKRWVNIEFEIWRPQDWECIPLEGKMKKLLGVAKSRPICFTMLMFWVIYLCYFVL